MNTKTMFFLGLLLLVGWVTLSLSVPLAMISLMLLSLLPLGFMMLLPPEQPRWVYRMMGLFTLPSSLALVAFCFVLATWQLLKAKFRPYSVWREGRSNPWTHYITERDWRMEEMNDVIDRYYEAWEILFATFHLITKGKPRT